MTTRTKTKTKFKSDLLSAIHEQAAALHTVDAINKATMRKFDESCLAAPEALQPEQIKKIRE